MIKKNLHQICFLSTIVKGGHWPLVKTSINCWGAWDAFLSSHVNLHIYKYTIFVPFSTLPNDLWLQIEIGTPSKKSPEKNCAKLTKRERQGYLENTSKTNLIRKIRNSHEAWNRGRPNRKTVDLEKLYILRHRKDKETIGFRIPNFLLEAIQLWWREIAEELVMHRIQKCDWGENWK